MAKFCSKSTTFEEDEEDEGEDIHWFLVMNMSLRAKSPEQDQVLFPKCESDILQQRALEEIQIERQKAVNLQEELERVQALYETNVVTARQRADRLQYQLEQEAKCHEEDESHGQLLLQQLQAEKDTLQQKMEDELKLVQKNADKQHSCLWINFEKVRNQLNIQVSINAEQANTIKEMTKEMAKEREQKQRFQEECDIYKYLYKEQKREANALQERTKRNSLCKRFLCFLTQMKPKKWRKKM